MRLLQLNPNGNESSALDFHPMVTVVTNLSASGRERVINAITALPRGEDPGCHGLLEAHGVLLDLTPETLRLLDLHGDLDVLIRPSDIPGATGGGGGGGIVIGGKPLGGDQAADGGGASVIDLVPTALPASVTPLSVEEFLAVTPEGEFPELDDIRFRQAQAREAMDILKEAMNRAKQGYEEAKVRTRVAQVALDLATTEAPRANLRLVTDGFEPDDAGDDEDDDDVHPSAEGYGGLDDEGVVPDLGGEPVIEPSGPDRDALAATAAATVASTAALAGRRDELEAREAELKAQVERIDRGINELAGLDARPIQVLLEAIHNPAPVEYVPSQRGQELADEFVRLQNEVAVLEGSLEARGLGSNQAMARLDQARVDLAAAEKAMRPPEFTDLDRSALEAAHDETIEAEKKARGRGKKRLEEAMAREQEILDRMGFPTWSAYVMGAGLMGIDPAAEQRVEKARFELEAAEAHWSDVAAMIEADPVHRELLDKLEAVYLEAFDLLHGDDEQDDLEYKLRNLQEPKREVSIDDLVDALAYQLELVGISLPAGSATLDRTVMIAEAFLEEASAIIDRLNELGAEKVDALTELQTIEQMLLDLPSEEDAAAKAQAMAEAAVVDATPDEDAFVDLGETADSFGESFDDSYDDAFGASGVGRDADADASPTIGAVADVDALPELTEADRAALERELEVAIEEEAEYLELVEAREALLDAAIRVETVTTSQLKKLATDLSAQAAGRGEGHAVEAEPEPEPAVAEPTITQTDAAFDDVSGVNAGPEAVEFYLLARLAALRSASFAGSVPLVIDDALTNLPTSEIERLLHKLERMSESVQIVYLSDDATVSSWAEGIGFERAAVVAAPTVFA
jgi:hypothetical protein